MVARMPPTKVPKSGRRTDPAGPPAARRAPASSPEPGSNRRSPIHSPPPPDFVKLPETGE